MNQDSSDEGSHIFDDICNRSVHDKLTTFSNENMEEPLNYNGMAGPEFIKNNNLTTSKSARTTMNSIARNSKFISKRNDVNSDDLNPKMISASK